MVESKFKIEKEKDYFIIWRKTPGAKESKVKEKWQKWQNIPARMVKNFDKIKIK